jgi:hypothetical protein
MFLFDDGIYWSNDTISLKESLLKSENHQLLKHKK